MFSQTCAAPCRTIICITGSGSDKDNLIYGSGVYLKHYSVTIIFISHQKNILQLFYVTILRISIISFCPEAPCHENCKMSSPNVFSVGVFFFLLSVLWLMISKCAAIGDYRWIITKHQSSLKFRGHNLTSQETRKANICHIWQLHKLVILRATRGDQTLLRSLSQTWTIS